MTGRRVVAAGVALAAVLTGCGSSGGSGSQGPPSFQAGPGRYRLTPNLPSNGAPPVPQLITVSGQRLTVAFGGAFTDAGKVRAALTVNLVTGSSGYHPVGGRYLAGQTIDVGDVSVHVLAVYAAAEQDHAAVDIQVTAH
ncbi:MAG: hypothetical protein J0H43_13060 [Actinobacteria bacterium]|nr:hypothetical protein [Actinomycetota bacterium]